MAQAASLLDSTVRHQVYLERLKSEEVNQFAAFLRDIDASLRDRLTRNDLTDFNRDRMERLLGSVEDSLTTIFDQHYNELAGHLTELGEYEAGFEAKSLENQLSEAGFESVIPSPAQVRAAVFSNPLSVRGADGGKLLEPFIKDWMKSDVKRLSGAIRQGFFEGQTNFQIIQRLRGTKANGYRDGLLAEVDRHAGAIVRTAVQHTASNARMLTWQQNGIDEYKWLSTLDGRTSTICRSLDQETFSIGKGPVPPAHINCRSTMLAVLPSKYDYLDKGATRASKDGPVRQSLSYYDWLKQQPEVFQDDVLGKTRALIFRNGEISSEKFAQLQLDKNFKPLSLAEMRKKEPTAFRKGTASASQTKQAENTKIAQSNQQASVTSWLGEAGYRRVAGALENPRIKTRMEDLGMTQAEGVAMRSYTETGYDDLNKRMWGAPVENPSAVDASADVLRSGLSKLPSFEGVSYRRTTMPKDVLDQHQTGNVVEYRAFTSSAYDHEAFTGDHRVIIVGNSGKSIGWISAYGDAEREILHTSPTRFEVVARYTDSDDVLTFKVIEL